MNRFHLMYQLVIGDFRERTRRYSFLLTMLGALFFGYLVITGKYSVQFSEYRSIYNSVWFGTLMAVTSSVMLSIAGFYLVKNSISRDRRTQVGQIIAATPLTSFEYLVAKFISNFLVLMAMAAILAVIAFLMLLFRNESGTVDSIAFSIPFLLISIPALAMVAAVAVFFDTVRWLRGSLGNIIYLFAIEMFLVMGMLHNSFLDLGGINLFVRSVEAGITEAYPGVDVAMQMGFIGVIEDIRMEGSNTFIWNGIDWTTAAILFRLIWIGAAVCALALAVPFFDRFDSAKAKIKNRRTRSHKKTPVTAKEANPVTTEVSYAQIDTPPARFSFMGMIEAELRLMLKGYHWSWYIIAAGLLAAQWIVPFNIARMYITPLAMAWPLLIWSGMGNRETRYNTGELLFSSPLPFHRQFPAIWLAGLVVALAAVAGMTLRSLMAGYWSYPASLLIGAVFVSSLALAFGTISGSKKLFEVIYLIIWYVGSIDHIAALDLLGTTEASITATKLIILILLSAGLLAAAGLARRRQVYG